MYFAIRTIEARNLYICLIRPRDVKVGRLQERTILCRMETNGPGRKSKMGRAGLLKKALFRRNRLRDARVCDILKMREYRGIGPRPAARGRWRLAESGTDAGHPPERSDKDI